MTEEKTIHFDKDTYPHLASYATVMEKPTRPMIGRQEELESLLIALERPELSNAFLLGDAGSGKTMLVQGASVRDPKRVYVEVDLAKMSASEEGEDGTVQMASRIKALFDEAIRYKRDIEQNVLTEKEGKTFELVLFIDEFHLLVQLSVAAAQAIKPILAESGRRGIRIIAATTFDEFHKYVENDQALMQRLQRINIREPERDVVVEILKSVAKTHGVHDIIYDEQVYDLIYDYSTRYVPADSQPRKSILMLDAMIGSVRMFPDRYKMDRHLLAHVIEQASGVRVNFDVNGREIEAALNARVFSQKFATKQLEQRLQIAVADLHDKTRPISSFLFTGPTGTGKTEMTKAMAELLLGDERAMIRFDMSEYALPTSLERFRESLTSQVWDKSHSILLFDEVEKADPAIMRLMLQVLDDGRLSNAQGREVSFLNTYIVLTTNAGSEIYKSIAHYREDSIDGADGLREYTKVIRKSLIENKSFAPEIINRMNAVVPFSPLHVETYKRIVYTKLQKLQEEVYRIHGVRVLVDKDVVDYLVLEIFDIDTDSGGARGVIAGMDAHVVSPIARYINNFPGVDEIGVRVSGKMRHRHKDILESEAKIVIGTINTKRARR